MTYGNTDWFLIDFIFIMAVLAGTLMVPLVRSILANQHLLKNGTKVGPEYWGELAYGAHNPVEPTIPTHKPAREITGYAGWAR